MEIIVEMKLNESQLPVDYRRIFISLIKSAIKEVDEETYCELFDSNKQKPYTFSIHFPLKNFDKDIIYLKGTDIKMKFSSSDMFLSAMFLQGFLSLKNRNMKFGETELAIKKASIEREKHVSSTQALVRFLSPLVVQKNEMGKDWFYSSGHEDFDVQLFLVLKAQIQALGFKGSMSGFNLIPIEPKKTVVKFYEKQIEASLGDFLLIGSPQLIDWLSLSGIGSKRSSGFGKFTVLQEVK